MCAMRCCSQSSALHKPLIIFVRKVVSMPIINRNCHFSNSFKRKFRTYYSSHRAESANASGVDDILMGYIFGKQRATEVAHAVWKYVVQKGDTVVDATCGNGYDTLAMLKMVMDDSGRGCVYGMDIQEDAVRNTSSLLDLSLDPMERKSVKLFTNCHSRMMEVLPKNSPVRLVAFNLGYLPGGNKEIITRPETTSLALEAAKEVLVPGGLISVVVYVGHPGGRDEYETILAFASTLSVESWTCSLIQMLNRPTAPILMFLFKR
ncbi:hypothetical protein Ancab_023317 [Ancistrocladus abbreviatus]